MSQDHLVLCITDPRHSVQQSSYTGNNSSGAAGAAAAVAPVSGDTVMEIFYSHPCRGAAAVAALAAAGVVTSSSGGGINRGSRRVAAVAATSAGVVALSSSCSNGISARVGRERREETCIGFPGSRGTDSRSRN